MKNKILFFLSKWDKRYILLFISLFLFSFYNSVYAVDYKGENDVVNDSRKEITGYIYDENGEPIIGANIVEKDVEIVNGTITDSEGKFRLIVNENATIRISYIGYLPQEVNTAGRLSFKIILKEDSEVLEEVVVTGYGGSQLRSKSTNSISKVDTKTFAKGVYSNPAQALSGAIPGVRVSQTSGNPTATPKIILRGGTNFDGSGDPLIIVDGVVRSSLSDINPNDIESMEVMKDAGATAIYGARANNGVVLITTKTGKSGTSSIDLNIRYGLNYLNIPYDFVNARDYLYWQRNAYKTASQYFQSSSGDWVGVTTMNSLKNAVAYGTGNSYWKRDANGNPIIGTPANGLVDNYAVWSPMLYSEDLAFLLDQGWETMIDPVYGDKIIFRNWDMVKANINSPSQSQDYNLGLSGGNDKGHYYANIGYNKSEGMALDNVYNRFTFTLNADYKIRSWLTSYSNLSFQDARWRGLPPTQTSESDYFSRMLSAPPTMQGYNAAGELLLGQSAGDGNQAVNINKFIRKNNTDKFSYNQSFKIDFSKKLFLKTSVSWLYSEGYYESFNRDYLQSTNNINRTRASSANLDRDLSILGNAVLNYKNQINLHSIEGMLGAEYYDEYSKGFSASGSGAPTDDFMDLAYTSSEEGKRSIDSYHTRQRILSSFGRINYDYNARYLLSLVFRYDGYSKLMGDNQWGLFPGISGGWVFYNEPFMEDLSNSMALSFGKLRMSYGVNGNVSGIGAYTLQGSYSTPKYDGSMGYLLNAIPNPYLKWERSNTFELGMDLSFLSNRITTYWTYYNRLTADKFSAIPLPTSSGLSSITTNNGAIRNYGFEGQIDYRIIDTKDLKWNLSMNMAYNKNIVEKLPENGLPRNRQGGQEVYTGNGNETIWVGGYQEGMEPGVIYAYKAEGIYKSYDEIPGNLVDKSVGYWGGNSIPLYGPDKWTQLTDADKIKANGLAAALPIQPGDVKWKDVNGDGVIDRFDQVKIGNTMPRLLGGINSYFIYKNLTFSARMDFGLGFYIIDYRMPWILGNMQGTFSTIEEVKKTWTPENPNAKYPTYTWADQLNKRNYDRPSSLFAYKGDYLGFRELSLTYSFPQLLIERMKLTRLDLSVTGQNLGYWTKGKNMYSPEANANDRGGYPLPRTVIFGLNLSF